MTTRSIEISHGAASLVRARGVASSVEWRQTIVRPAARHTASTSASTRVTSVGDMVGAVATAITSGGIEEVTGAAAPAMEDANTTAATLVVISILSSIDDADRQKFDVRNREERTALNLEIDRYDV